MIRRTKNEVRRREDARGRLSGRAPGHVFAPDAVKPATLPSLPGLVYVLGRRR